MANERVIMTLLELCTSYVSVTAGTKQILALSCCTRIFKLPGDGEPQIGS